MDEHIGDVFAFLIRAKKRFTKDRITFWLAGKCSANKQILLNIVEYRDSNIILLNYVS